MEAAARFIDVNLIADPLYGYIEIAKSPRGEASEQRLLDNPWLQRLRRIHQLQSAWWVFPTAEHSRFSHLLGAMHLGTLFARRLDASLRAAFPDAPSPACVESTLRLAGLLHDAGHGPFGHFFDREVLTRYGIDHEDVGRHLVLHQLGDLIGSLRASPAGHFDRGESVDPRWVAWVMAPADLPGYVPPGWLRALKPLLCGPASIDNLDYVPRDASMCGVRGVSVDLARLIHYSFVTDGTVALHGHATGALQMFLVARLHLYTQIYFHRTVRRFDLSMRELFAETVEQLLPGSPIDHLEAYLRLTDWSLLEAVERWRDAPPGSTERRLAGGWRDITTRTLPWHLAYEASLPAGVRLDDLRAQLQATLGTAAQHARFEVDVATATLLPMGSPATPETVAVYDPLLGAVIHRQAGELMTGLPQQQQLVRVFARDVDMVTALGMAARSLLG